MSIELDTKNAFQSFFVRSIGIADYVWLTKNVKSPSVADLNGGFQKRFNSFYVVRRNEDWKKDFYDVFDTVIHNRKKQSFKSILKSLSSKPNITWCEPSFSSKMLATINPDMPIWDDNVLSNLNLKAEWARKQHDTDNAVQIYEKICNWYKEYLSSDAANSNIEMFDSILPDYTFISKVKKIDYILWCMR